SRPRYGAPGRRGGSARRPTRCSSGSSPASPGSTRAAKRRPCSGCCCCRSSRRVSPRCARAWRDTGRGSSWPAPPRPTDAHSRDPTSHGRSPPGKTIVFVQPRASVRHLFRRLHRHRVAAVMGDRGWFGTERASRAAVLRAFAPLAQGGPGPTAALETDVLLATDMLSEGLNLQDAVRVIHYDVPWSPARLAQRVGRIDRAGSPHAYIETMTFLPPPSLADALAIERRWLAKARAQAQTGAAQIELADGGTAAAFDWCDRLQQLAGHAERPAARGGCAAVAAAEGGAVVLVVRLAGQVEAVVVTSGGVRADPAGAAALLERAAGSPAVPLDRAALELALRRAAPLVRSRLEAIERARWRAADRDRLTRRLIPWVLAAARRAAARRRHSELARLDALVSRLALGMTPGEGVLL